MHIVAIANSKGGSGKTTTTINLASALSRKGKRVLLFDFDPQCSLSNAFKIDYSQDQIFSDDIIGSSKINVAAAPVEIRNNLYLVPATKALSGYESVLSQSENDLLRLRDAINRLKMIDGYDYIFIDPPGSTDIFMAATLAAVDSVIIPTKPTDMDFHALSEFLETIESAKELNPKLQVRTLLFNQVNVSSKSKDLFASFLEGHPLKEKLSNSMIRTGNSVGLSFGKGQTIFEYDPKSKVVDDYQKLAQEVLSWE